VTTAAIKYFDTLMFVKKCKIFGMLEELAEYQVQEYEKALEVAVANMKDELKIEELTTKKDLEVLEFKLQKEIVHSRNQIILWIVGFLAANGIIQHWL
jgi:hypothetical protein